MSYTPLPISKRIKKLKETYRSLPVPQESNPYLDRKFRCYRSGDRWMTLGYLRGWYNHADAETTILRTAYAEAEELYEARPIVLEDELILGHLYLPEYSKEEWEEYHRLADAFAMSSHTMIMRAPRKDHLGLDFEKLLSRGISGILADIEKKLSEIDISSASYPDYDAVKKIEFYEALKIELTAVLDLAERYSKHAFSLAEREERADRRAELFRMAETLKKVPKKPAESFFEAVSSVHFFLSGLFGLYPLCRPDRYLYPYYERDVKAKKITKEFAQELVDNFCLGVSDRVFSRSACGFIVGGTDKDGELVENELTYMFLTALEHLRLPDPNGALAVNEMTGNEILSYAADILSKGTTHPAFYNDTAIISSLVENYGVAYEDAVNYIHSTCAEISVVGRSKAHSTPFSLDLPRILVDVCRSGRPKSVSEIIEAMTASLADIIKRDTIRYATRMLEGSRIGNEACRVWALVEDCIERGRNMYEGGERYVFIQPIAVGFSTAVDSIYAINELVFKNNRISLAEFTDIVDSDFKDNEELRLYIRNKVVHYGNDNDAVDAVAGELISAISSLLKRDDMPYKKFMMPGTFTYVNHATAGEQMGATYDGRRKGEAYSDGCGPVQGMDRCGPTAMVKSLTSFDQSRLLGGMVVNIKFAKDGISGENKSKFITILRAFLKRGGIEMQVNAVDRETLIAAKNNPELHADLIVRIGGYSDYFVRLRPSLQDEIIKRTEY